MREIGLGYGKMVKNQTKVKTLRHLNWDLKQVGQNLYLEIA